MNYHVTMCHFIIFCSTTIYYYATGYFCLQFFSSLWAKRMTLQETDYGLFRETDCASSHTAAFAYGSRALKLCGGYQPGARVIR